MGAREDLLAAAKSLTARGKVPFSPKELIAEARAQGCGYPDVTLRTFIAGPMCLDSPDHHAVQYGDLRRVSHGRYRLASAADPEPAERARHPRATRPLITKPASGAERGPDAPRAWHWEGNVQAAVVRHLAAEGWSIMRVADTSSREHGVDIDAVRGSERLVIEVKGFPANESQPQARTYFGNALLSGLLMRADHTDARVVLAFPAVTTFANLARRTAEPLRSAGVEVWLVSADGEVTQADPPSN